MKILLCDKANNLLEKRTVLDGYILNAPFVILAYKLGLKKLPNSYFENSSKGLAERLNTKLSIKERLDLVKKVEKVFKKKNEFVNSYTREIVNTFINGLNKPKIYTRDELQSLFFNSTLDYFQELSNELLENERVEKISFLMED